jgi:hypothetical protein
MAGATTPSIETGLIETSYLMPASPKPRGQKFCGDILGHGDPTEIYYIDTMVASFCFVMRFTG